ncbi:MAG: hypothetical protein FWD60_00975 [Candidatus Azobacteroides sp.]|nr:hypothetical protein [Candidatus Azobacteroides sp.]
MVFFNPAARQDLEEIRIGLLYWEKIKLSKNFIHSYIDDIIDECYYLDKKHVHLSVQYETHRQYGEKVHTYKRNANTIWYIIYNKTGENIYVEKIISNYMTVS